MQREASYLTRDDPEAKAAPPGDRIPPALRTLSAERRGGRRLSATVAGLLLALAHLGCAPESPPGPGQDFDWRRDWAVAPGFSIEPHSRGYQFPTAIAFVPEPGSADDDPLYFVTELRGTVKVVTNDRTVHVFAKDFFLYEPPEELPAQSGESGLAGICLAPEQGYIFVTFVYHDEQGVLRNNMVRFETEPHSFSIAPRSRVEFAELFAHEVSATSHQIGPCQVGNGLLYVSVGDGEQPPASQNLDSLLGKVLRMTLDGQPALDNPFTGESSVHPTPTDYVWAYGLRNPFGLKLLGDRLFVADNGPSVDRFMEVWIGENYLWDGTDWSIASAADFVFFPSLSPVQLDYLPAESHGFPDEYGERFYVAIAGSLRMQGERFSRFEGVVSIDYEMNDSRLLRTPEYFVQYRGTGLQAVTGLAFGSDGLYFVPIFPDETGDFGIYRVWYAPDREHPYVIGRGYEPSELMGSKGCLACHSLRGYGRNVGPALDRDILIPHLKERLCTSTYEQLVEELDRIEEEPFREFRQARAEVLAAECDERLGIWVRYKLQEPRFDDMHAQMPGLGVTEYEAGILADYLLKSDDRADSTRTQRLTKWVQRMIPRPRYRHLVFAAMAGFLAGLLAFRALQLLRRR